MQKITREQAFEWVTDGDVQTRLQRRKSSQERLRQLVTYARQHSAYFRCAYKDIGDDWTLEELPVTTKSGLMEKYNDWVTDPEVTEESVREYLSDIKNITVSYLGRYTVISTSGTTGAPMPMVRDSFHNTIHSCLKDIRLYRGIDRRYSNPSQAKIASVIATNSMVSSYSSAMRVKLKLKSDADNILILSVMTAIDELVQQLNAFQPEMLTGYPSVLAALANEKLRGTLNISPKLLLSSAEKLSPEAFDTLNRAFDCPVLNNYCSTEGGEIAMSCREGHLHLNDDWVLLEPVDDKFRPVTPGEWSTGVLITDLSNYIQPIIRYYVGDCVRFNNEPCPCGSSLPVLEISGRMGDSLSLNGKTVGFPVLYAILQDVQSLLSWQIIQTNGHTLEARFIEKGGADRMEIGGALIETLKESLRNYGCGDIDVNISNKSFIKNKSGGKSPYVINR